MKFCYSLHVRYLFIKLSPAQPVYYSSFRPVLFLFIYCIAFFYFSCLASCFASVFLKQMSRILSPNPMRRPLPSSIPYSLPILVISSVSSIYFFFQFSLSFFLFLSFSFSSLICYLTFFQFVSLHCSFNISLS